jgi:hypothetical protein
MPQSSRSNCVLGKNQIEKPSLVILVEQASLVAKGSRLGTNTILPRNETNYSSYVMK